MSKQGDLDDVNNYCPIFIIPVVVKVLEKMVYEHLYAFLEEHDILSKYQLDFGIIHSTATAFLEATDSWPCYLDTEKINAVIFVDLKEAFDSTDHNIL